MHKKFGTHVILNDISFGARANELTAIIGPSGCGKSTLLRSLNFLSPPTSGEIVVKGESFSPPRKSDETDKSVFRIRDSVGMIFQEFHLFPHLSVERNISLALRHVKKLSSARASEEALKALERVNMTKFAQRSPESLSGGQQQRIAIARALALKPDILLYDEPTSALDPQGSKDIMRLMNDLKSENMAQIVVTHDMHLVKECADQIILLEEGELIAKSPRKEIARDSAIYEFIQISSFE